jgi:mono/diheme cytochrome c family protein
MRAKHLFLGIAIFSLLISVFWAQEQQKQKPAPANPPAAGEQTTTPPAVAHSFTITPEEEARKNPTRFSEISVERGKKLFATQCAMCHGLKGDGKGDLAEAMKLKLTDFTEAGALKNRTDGALFAIISSGNGVMPGENKRMKDFQVWEIVNYLRALGGAKPLKSTQEELERGTTTVPE